MILICRRLYSLGQGSDWGRSATKFLKPQKTQKPQILTTNAHEYTPKSLATVGKLAKMFVFALSFQL